MTATDLQILVRKPSGDLLAVKEVPPDGLLYLGDDTRVNTHLGFFQEFFSTEFPRIAQLFGLYDIEEDRERAFLLRVGKPEQPLRIIARGREQDVYLRWEVSAQPELHQVISMQYGGHAVINVAEVRLTHSRFNTTGVSYGESKIGGLDALVVATGNGSEEKVTLRLRGDETETEAAVAPPNGYASASTDEADTEPHSDRPLDA